jgi:gliding motility-associated-like protein
MFPAILFGQYDWVQQTSGTTSQLNRLDFVDENNGFAAGWNGVFVKTTDGGVNWNGTSAPTNEICIGLDFQNATTGFWLSDTCNVYKTTDAGSNWTQVYTSWTSLDARQIFLTQSRLFVLRNSDVLFSDDLGATWDSISTGLFGLHTDISFSDNNNGIVVTASGNVATTSDGGDTWTAVSSITSPDWIWRAEAVSTNILIAVGGNGEIFRSGDGGSTWALIPSGTTQDFYGVHFYNGTHGLAVAFGNTIVQSLDGGLSWSAAPTSNGSLNVLDVKCLAENKAFICGPGGNIWKSPMGYDIANIVYTGPDTVCAGQPFDFSFQFDNLGPGDAVNPQFQVLANTQSFFGSAIEYNGVVSIGQTQTILQGNATLNAGVNNMIIFASELFVQNNNTLVFDIVAVNPDSTSLTGGTNFCPGDTVTLEATGGNAYNWSDGNTGPIQVYYPTQDAQYNVDIVQDYCTVTETAYAYLDSACVVDSVDTTVVVIPLLDNFAFSPNGDGINEVLIFDFIDSLTTTNYVHIYNRWGDEVFYIDNYDNDARIWTGEQNGTPVPAGTYYFLVQFPNDETSRTGWVQVFR